MTHRLDPVLMECYKDGLSHIGAFDGNESTEVEHFLAQIERIGNLIEAQPNVLCSMTKAKLVGEPANWFTANQATLTEWEELKDQMLTRSKTVTSSSQLFEKLTKRRQEPDESIITYYDSVIKLCREYDPSMSDKMKISFLEKGLKDELKIQQKAEAELLSEVQLPSEITQSYFIPSTISTITRPAFCGQSPRPHLFRSRGSRYYSNQTTQRVPQSPFNRSRGLLRNKYAQLQPRPISSTTNSQSQQQTPALAKPEQTVRNATQEVFQTSTENRNAQQLALRGQQSKGRIQCRPLLIINANNRQFTLSKHTKLGTIAFQTEPTIWYTIASKPVKGNVRFRTDKSREFQSKIPIHQCYTLKGAINTGDHALIHIPPYRQSGKDQQRIQDETDKLLKRGIIEPSTSPIQTDASKVGIGAVLLQVYPEGNCPVAFLSKKLSPTQQRWCTSEQECYAIISAIEKWHQYIDGVDFEVQTDHKPLKWLNKKAQGNDKCERWRLKFQQYRMTIT
ncbi:unnamed protein product, partial [Didymodactylos carnosus]